MNGLLVILFLYFLSVPVRLVRPCDVPIQHSVHLVVVHSKLYTLCTDAEQQRVVAKIKKSPNHEVDQAISKAGK